jgi:ribosome-binding factor A
MSIRQERIQDLIRTHLSDLLLREVTDPALHDVTITDVKVDRETHHADIHVNALGDESREKEVMQGLRRANGFLRRQLAARLRLRNMPELHFRWDRTLANAMHMDEVLDALKKDAPHEDVE